KDLGAIHAGTGSQRLGDVDRIDLAVLGQEDAADGAFEIVMWQTLLDLANRNDIHFKPETLGHRSAALQFLEPALRQGKGYRAVLLEAGGLAGFLLQSFEQPGRIFGKLGQIARGAQLSDEPRRMPGGAASELLALEQHSVLDAKPGQMIGDRRADYAAPHNDDTGEG